MAYKESIILRNSSNKFSVITLGCKINLYESESISFNLIKENYIKTDIIEESDIIIINTCTVTGKADSKSRNAVRKARRANPECIIIVCGCLVDTDIDELKNTIDADIFISNTDKDKLTEIIKNYDKSVKPLIYKSTLDGSFNFSTSDMSKHSRAFLKIQDGCNNGCSYCKIPLARGISRSKNSDLVIKDIEGLVKNGFNEIVLSGINLGSYNYNSITFSSLLSVISLKFQNVRFRISSVELEYIDDAFLHVFKNDNICSHIHLPLQSGSDKILKLMNRRYELSEYSNKIDDIRNIKKDLFISTDLIIGFPGESDEDFKSTLDFIKMINFSYIHLFAYSPRKKTKAYDMKPFIPERIRDERLVLIKAEADKMNLSFCSRFIGREMPVIIENKTNGFYRAKSDNYIDLLVKSEKILLSKKLYNVKFESIINNKNYAVY